MAATTAIRILPVISYDAYASRYSQASSVLCPTFVYGSRRYFYHAKSGELIGYALNAKKIKHAEFGNQIIIPGGLPMVYTGSCLEQAGATRYPECLSTSITPTSSGNWANSGGAGTYHYCATYVITLSDGSIAESAPSPSVSAVITDETSLCAVSVPALHIDNDSGVSARLYRTSADGNDFFQIDITPSSNVFTDNGERGLTSTSGLNTITNTNALYTLNGTLENIFPLSHYVSCVHGGRYFYSRPYKNRIWYSKSRNDGIAIEFNDVLYLDASSVGGETCSLESFSEKLFIGKERAWLVAYGEPLNDAGVGQGFAPPRIITQEAGVKYPTAAAAGTPGIFFINSVDGLIYLIDGGENVQYVGAPVRHYCETYAYDNVWYAPQDGCVRFSSATVGAPTLSFNYRYNRWSTFTGRYDDGIRAAFAAPVGPSNSYVDVVMDVNGNVYVQDPTGTNATAESFNVNISTSWISLGDILGYGKFYKWTLIGSKKGAALNLNLKTAYDYEPYWADSQDYNASALTAFSTSNQFGTMNSNTVVDQALKIQVDGSRHKTDAIRLCISTNNGTTRDSVELLGAKLEIGVRPGSTRLGSGRTVS